MSIFCVGIALSPLASGNWRPLEEGGGDTALYRSEVDRIRAGEGYYEAVSGELLQRGYPTQSVFNWRPPLPVWLIGKMPDPMLGKVLLGLLGLAAMLMGFEALAREQGHGIGRPVACALLLSGATVPCVLGDAFVNHELWAGMLIALSVCAFGLNRPYLGVAMGVLAVFFRELAIPYCAVGVVLACRHDRRRELAAWLVGLAAWAVYYGLHCWQALQWIPADALSHSQGWVRFGGAAFVISLVQMNIYLILLPQWVTALYFVAAMLGFGGWNTRLGLRVGLAASLFVVAFGVVGQQFNQYWGSLLAPLFCFGVVRFPASLRDLCTAAGFRSRALGNPQAGCRGLGKP